MKRNDQMSSVVWLSFAIYVCIESIRLPLGSWRDPGPGLMPLIAGTILGALSFSLYLKTRSRISDDVQGSWYPRERWQKLIFILVALLAYAIFLEILGFLLDTFFLLVFLFRGIEPQKWLLSIGGAALASMIAYAIFELWLKTQLPRGVLGF